MEHTSAWGGPFEFQLAATNWSAEEVPAGDAQAWAAPAVDHPLEYASIVDIFGSSCSLQPYVVPASSSGGGGSSAGHQQLIEYNHYYNYNAAAAQCDRPVVRATSQEDPSFEEQMKKHMKKPMELFETREKELDNAYDAHFLKQKMHRYPPSIRALSDDGLYTVPRVVAIGPYHHFDGDHLKEAEKVKHVAARHCMKKSGLDVQGLYQEVVSAAKNLDATGLYDKDVMEGMGDEDQLFLPMLFYDACFLVMYMVKKSGTGCDPTLYDLFESNDNNIAHDIMLLENQIPWPVVDAVLRKLCKLGRTPMEIKKRFISRCKDGCLQDRVGDDDDAWLRIFWDDGYEAPHLLGLIRFYVVGKSSCCRERKVSQSDLEKIHSIPISAGAIELAEMGISLTASRTTNEIPADMGIGTDWIIFGKLSIAPLCLNDLHASMLVNMAALELCVTPDFWDEKKARREDSAVCSYLRLLCMLVHREEDVHELRTNGILQGAGLTNNKTLNFFTCLQSLREGPSYGSVMIEIQGYMMKRWWWLWLYKLVYRYRNFIIGFVAAAGALASILQLFKGGN